jgi:hypothetical protein
VATTVPKTAQTQAIDQSFAERQRADSSGAAVLVQRDDVALAISWAPRCGRRLR